MFSVEYYKRKEVKGVDFQEMEARSFVRKFLLENKC